MKKLILFAALLMALPLTVQAQDDDMYFVPTKKNVKKANEKFGIPSGTYYSGSSRDVNEYNRRPGSSFEMIEADSTMVDVIDFSASQGVYPDSVSDFELTRNMARWDGYEPSQAYWEGYQRGRNDEWSISSWHSPWYYNSFYPWYDSWYDPWWYHSSYYGWYDPWYYPYHHYGWYGWGGYYGGWHGGGWYYPHHYAGSGWSRGRTITGTSNHSVRGRSATGRSWNSIGNSRTTNIGRNTGGVRTVTGTTISNRNSGSTWNIGNSRSGNSSYTPQHSVGNSGGVSSGSSSRGGSYGGGGSMGARGGGHIGGRTR